MDYQKLISEVKDDIDNYSFDDSEYQKIYDRAYSDLEAGYNVQNKALKQSYYDERRRATGENVLNTRNAAEQLVERGLARSGESADLIIGQNIALNNRLSDLSQSHTAAEAELASDYSNRRAELGKDMAQRVTEASKAERADLYNRLEHLESLYADDRKFAAEMEADKEKWQSQLDFDRYALDTQLNADREKWQNQLDFDRYSFDTQLSADKDKQQNQLDFDRYVFDTQLSADKDKQQNQLDFDRYVFDTQLDADKEKWQNQLDFDRYSFDTQLSADKDKQQNQLDFDRYALNAQLGADKDKLQNQLDFDRYTFDAQLDADKEKWQNQLDFDRYTFDTQLEADEAEKEQEQLRWEAEMEAEEEKWQSQLASQQYINQSNINADKEKWQAQLENDRYKFNTGLEIEEEERREEQKDKVYSWFSNLFGHIFDGSSGNSTDTTDGLDPDVTVQTMANNIVNRYSDKTGGLSEYTQDQVYSDFARLIATSGLDSQYATQVLAALRSKGFNKDFDIALASKDYVREGYTLYNQTFDDYYEGMLSDGTPADDALTAATEAAENAVTEHIDAQNLDRNTRRQVLRMYGITN